MVTVGYMEKRRNFFYGFPCFTGGVFTDLALSGLQANMRLGLTFQSLCTDQIGLQYMVTIYLGELVVSYDRSFIIKTTFCGCLAITVLRNIWTGLGGGVAAPR